MRLFVTVTFIFTFSIGFAQFDDCSSASKKSLKSFEEALTMLRRQAIGPAINLLKESIDESEDNLQAKFVLGDVYFNRGQYTRAKSYLSEVYENCTLKEATLYQLAFIEYYLANHKMSADYFTQYLDEQTSNDEKRIRSADSLLTLSKEMLELVSNPVPFDPKPVEGISTKSGEYLPVISPDNEIMLFTRRYKKENKFNVIGSGATWVEELTISYFKDGQWEKGSALPKPFNAGLNEGGASLSIENKEMFLTVCNTKDGFGSCDIYTTVFDGEEWSELENMGPGINDSMWQSQVSLNSKGDILYFSSDKIGGFGGKDLYKCVRKKGGIWSEPVNLGEGVNTHLDEKSPFIHQDDQTLYFSSEGHQNLGGFDIFYARSDQFGEFSKSVNIGYPINSPEDDLGFFVSTDGKTAYFASNKLEGVGDWDLYSFPLYEEARPKKLMFMKGTILDENGEVVKNAQIEIKDLKTQETRIVNIDSNSGAYVFSHVIENDQMVTIKGSGHFYSSSIVRSDEESVVSENNIELKKAIKGEEFKIENILFETSSYELKEVPKLVLMELVSYLQENPGLHIEVGGHTDNIGDDSANQILSENRAKVVMDFLVLHNIRPSRLSFKGYGETKPVASNDSEKGRRLNRRTVVKIL